MHLAAGASDTPPSHILFRRCPMSAAAVWMTRTLTLMPWTRMGCPWCITSSASPPTGGAARGSWQAVGPSGCPPVAAILHNALAMQLFNAAAGASSSARLYVGSQDGAAAIVLVLWRSPLTMLPPAALTSSRHATQDYTGNREYSCLPCTVQQQPAAAPLGPSQQPPLRPHPLPSPQVCWHLRPLAHQAGQCIYPRQAGGAPS